MSQLTESVITREDVEQDISLLGKWVRQQIRLKGIVPSEGCTLAIKEFGNHNPYSDYMIYNEPSIQKYKNFWKQQAGRKGIKTDGITKDDLLKRIKRHKKEKIKMVLDELEESAYPHYEILSSMSKD